MRNWRENLNPQDQVELDQVDRVDQVDQVEPVQPCLGLKDQCDEPGCCEERTCCQDEEEAEVTQMGR